MLIPNNILNLLGKRYSRLQVTEYIGKNYYNRTTWKCKCDCGNEVEVTGNSLRSGKTGSCGCLQKEVVSSRYDVIREEMVGRKFGRLTVINIEYIEKGSSYYNCACSCGNNKVICVTGLLNGNNKSCGCLGIESRITHGLSNHPLSDVLANMKARCYNSNNPAYHRYGGRGIKICDEWLSDFKVFYDWAMTNGYRPELTIERINNDGNYEPGNCRWATMLEQAQNRSSTRVTVDDIVKIKNDNRKQSVIAEEYGLDPSTISRIKSR